MTRFATFYLTLGSLNEKKNPIIRMFISDEWKESKCSKTRDGKNIENIILDKTFWGNIIHCLRGAYPLLHVLRIVDSEGKAAMGYMYSEIDRAKEKIKDAFQSVELSYKPLWDIIDARWDKQLFRPLHAASYYLNPQIHYSPNFKVEYDVKKGLYDCLDILVGDSALITIIDSQLEDFKSKAKFFGRDVAKNALKTKTPSQWWDSYGDEHPELQKFAIRVLSLTCSSSGCERNWSAFEMVHTKRRNRLKTSTMNDVVFVMTNSRLARKKPSRNTADYSFEDLDSDEEWIVEDENMMENMEEFDTQNGVNLAPQEDRGKDGGPLIDLEIPLLDDDAFNELLNFSPNENQNTCDRHYLNKEGAITFRVRITLITPGHGQEDYVTGQKYVLPILSPVDEHGIFVEEARQFSGLDVLGEGNTTIVKYLDENLSHILEESYGSSWDLVFRKQDCLSFPVDLYIEGTDQQGTDEPTIPDPSPIEPTRPTVHSFSK
ncbi:hypothetical protein S83_039580, partial [Arachis hypogaea]